MPSDKRARQRALREQKLAVQQRRAQRNKNLRRGGSAVVVVGIVILLVVLLSGGSKPKSTASKSTSSTSTSTSSTTTTAPKVAAIAPVCPPAGGSAKRQILFTKAPPLCISKTGVYDATVKTDVGTFVMQMHAANSLLAVNNFVFLARYHFYDGITFHRVIPDFVVQGGDPSGTGDGSAGYSFTGNLPASSCNAKHDCYPLGAVAMANSSGPTTDGSQFFIVVGSQGEQLPASYTLFGQVISGMPVVQKIAADGNASDNGSPPKVTHHMISVTISQVAA